MMLQKLEKSLAVCRNESIAARRSRANNTPHKVKHGRHARTAVR